MSELTLVKIPVHVIGNLSSYELDAERVIGVAGPQSPTVLEHGYRPDGSETEESVCLDDDTTERIIDLYQRTIHREHSAREYYNCHIFAAYALGKITRLRYPCSLNTTSRTPIPDGAPLSSGEAYGVTTASGEINHSILGIDRPTHNLSVIGDFMPLVVSRNEDIVPFYNAERLQRVQFATQHIAETAIASSM